MYNQAGAIIIEGHVQGLSNTRSLGEAGIPVIVLDKNNCIAQYSKYCRKFYRCPDFNNNAFIDFLIQLGKKENLQGWVLLPSNDHAVFNISRHKSYLEEIFRIITPDVSIIEQLYNKEKLLEHAYLTGTPFPQSWFPQNYEENLPNTLKFPLLIKGKYGLTFYKSLGRKAFLINNNESLLKIFAQLKSKINATELFIQELIPDIGNDKTISFTAFCEKGIIKTHWAGVKLREHPEKFGTATFAESIDSSSLLNLSEKLLKKLNYTGVCEVEYLRDPRDNQFKLIEINARTWLWVGLAKACGINYACLIYNYANNIPNTFPEKYLLGLKWINVLTDLPYSLISIFRGNLNVGSYIKSLFSNKVYAIFSFKDILPALYSPFLFIVRIKNR